MRRFIITIYCSLSQLILSSLFAAKPVETDINLASLILKGLHCFNQLKTTSAKNLFQYNFFPVQHNAPLKHINCLPELTIPGKQQHNDEVLIPKQF